MNSPQISSPRAFNSGEAPARPQPMALSVKHAFPDMPTAATVSISKFFRRSLPCCARAGATTTARWMRLFFKADDGGMPQERIICGSPFTKRFDMRTHLFKRSAHATHYFFRVALWTWKILLKLLPPSLEVFLHRQFGDRYFVQIAGSFLLFVFSSQCVLSAPEIASRQSEQFSLGLYSLCFLCLILFHIVDRFIRQSRVGGGIYSYSPGIPFPFWQRLCLTPVVVQRYAEPALCFFVALILRNFSRAVAFWIEASTIVLFVKCHIEWWSARKRALDALDG